MLNHGIQGSCDENTGEIAIVTLYEKLDLELSNHNIDRTHSIGTETPTRKKLRPIIMKLVRYADRNKVFTNKKRLKNSGVSITESLTERGMEWLNRVR